jgi:hypothetical protein
VHEVPGVGGHGLLLGVLGLGAHLSA